MQIVPEVSRGGLESAEPGAPTKAGAGVAGTGRNSKDMQTSVYTTRMCLGAQKIIKIIMPGHNMRPRRERGREDRGSGVGIIMKGKHGFEMYRKRQDAT